MALIEKGKGLTRNGQYPEALEVLREALEVRPDPRILLWIGYAQEQMGTLLAARASYLEAKSVARAGKFPVAERNVDQALVEIGAKIPRIEVELPSGVEAKIWIDRREIPRPSDGVEVDPGPHSVVVIGPGRDPYKASIVAKIGEVSVVAPVLARIPTPPPAPPPAPEKRKSEPSVSTFVIVGAAATALGVAMGTGFAVLSEGKRIEREEQREATRGCQGLECEPFSAPERARARFLGASLTSFVAAGAIGAATLTYSLATRAREPRGAAKAAVSVVPGGVAGMVAVTW